MLAKIENCRSALESLDEILDGAWLAEAISWWRRGDPGVAELAAEACTSPVASATREAAPILQAHRAGAHPRHPGFAEVDSGFR